jgi:hypothetical protein
MGNSPQPNEISQWSSAWEDNPESQSLQEIRRSDPSHESPSRLKSRRGRSRHRPWRDHLCRLRQIELFCRLTVLFAGRCEVRSASD